MSNDRCSTSVLNDGQTNEAQKLLQEFWPNVLNEVLSVKDSDFKNQELPLARIKKIMKLDDNLSLMVRIFCFNFKSM